MDSEAGRQARERESGNGLRAGEPEMEHSALWPCDQAMVNRRSREGVSWGKQTGVLFS